MDGYQERIHDSKARPFQGFGFWCMLAHFGLFHHPISEWYSLLLTWSTKQLIATSFRNIARPDRCYSTRRQETMSNPPAPSFGAGVPPPMMPPGMAGTLPPPPPPFGAQMEISDPEEAPPLPADASQSLYIQNLNEKVKLETMKATLNNLFSNYGTVLSVVSHTNLRMRGQAFVSLDNVDAADKARREAHLFPLYGKAMKISFAKSKSDSVVLQEVKEEGGEESEEFKKHKEQRLEHKKMARRGNVLRRRELEKKIRAKRAAAGEIAEPEKAASSAANKRAQQEMPDEYLPPNKMLFLQKIPEGVGKGELESLFSAYSGYVDVQTIPGKADIAFVEFSDIPSSVTARGALNGYNFGAGDKLKVSDERSLLSYMCLCH